MRLSGTRWFGRFMGLVRRRGAVVAVGAAFGVFAPGVVVAPVARAQSVPQIYWANGGGGTIGVANLDGTGVNQSLISGAPLPQGVAVDGQHVYWAGGGFEAIGAANLDGTGVSQFFIGGVGSPEGVAVDGQHIYWADDLLGFNRGTIVVANLDGTDVNQRFVTGASNPFGVAVDGQHIYWANSLTGTIGVANLDGTGVNQNFITVPGEPFGVAVDGQHIYWANFAANTIGEANLDGTDVNQSFITGANAPAGVAVDGQHIYWTNSGAGTIGEANVDGTDVNQSFISGASAPVGVAVSVPVARLTPASPPGFAVTSQGTLGPPVALTLADAGQRDLSVSALSFTGADAGDFVIGTDGCVGSLAPGGSCQLTVQFAPEAPGARSATLEIATNDYANSPLQVPLSGTGGQPPLGPPGSGGQAGATGQAGAGGATGASGAAGATGRPGPAGRIALVVCRKTTKTIRTRRRKRKVTVQKCSTRLISGTINFTAASRDVGATVARAGVTYATGLAVPTGPSEWQLVLGDKRILRPGRYTLTLTTHHGPTRTVEREAITITGPSRPTPRVGRGRLTAVGS